MDDVQMRQWQVLIRMQFALILVATVCVGCDVDGKREILSVRKTATSLSQQEMQVWTSLVELLERKLNAKDQKNESASTRDFLRDAIRLLESVPTNLNRLAVLSQLRQDVLTMEIPRKIGEKPRGSTWRVALSRFIDAAYSVSDLSSALKHGIPDFDHLVFDMEIDRRILQETEGVPKQDDGRSESSFSLVSGWQWHSFYSPDSDFCRYWRGATATERRSALEWFRKNKGQIPDWVKLGQ